MITRKQLVEALRVLHEDDVITKIVTRAKRIDVQFMSAGRDCLLVLPNPTPNDNNTNTKRTNKDRTTTTSPTNSTDSADNSGPTSSDSLRSTKGRKDHRTLATPGVLNRGS